VTKSQEDLDRHENILNRAIWYSSTKGFDKTYPRDKKVLLPNEVKG
jgi:hypothetical protein